MDLKAKIRIENLLYDKKDEIKEYRSKQNGGVTPTHMMAVLLNELMSGDVEEIAVCRKFKDGTAEVGWTTENNLEGMGMADYLKQHIYEEIFEE